MPATPRDVLKPRQERLAEVFYGAQLQSGQANAQQIVYGLEGEAETKKFKITAGEYFENGASEPVKIKAITAQTVASGSTTNSSQFCYILVEINEKEEVFQTVSALTTGTPVLPALTAGRIAIFYISIPNSFTAGTTEPTEGNSVKFVPIKYSAGNKAPSEGF